MPAPADANIADALCAIVNYRAGPGLATHSNAILILCLWLPARHLLMPSPTSAALLVPEMLSRMVASLFFRERHRGKLWFLVRPVRSVNPAGSPLVTETLCLFGKP